MRAVSLLFQNKHVLIPLRHDNETGMCLFALFQEIIDYKNNAIQRRGVEANGATALQPVEAPGPVCQQTAKK